MVEIDFDEIEEELELVVPAIYRQFVEFAKSKRMDLARYGIYSNTEMLLKGNWHLRFQLEESDPSWEYHFLDFGVGDGCGNYYFLTANNQSDDEIRLWAHDPPGIENVSSGAEFFQKLAFEIENDFEGPNKHSYSGNGTWS